MWVVSLHCHSGSHGAVACVTNDCTGRSIDRSIPAGKSVRRHSARTQAGHSAHLCTLLYWRMDGPRWPRRALAMGLAVHSCCVPIPPQPNSLDFVPEAQLADALALKVVPDHHLSTIPQHCPDGRTATSIPQNGSGATASPSVRTLLGGYFGVFPPPTRARMLHRKSISTRPIPPSSKSTP